MNRGQDRRQRAPVFLSVKVKIMNRNLIAFFACVSVLGEVGTVWSQGNPPVTLEVHADRPGAKINPAMWGIFFEDINLGADGGLYAELVKNRSFEFPDPLMGWNKISPSNARGELSIQDENPFDPANPHYARIHSEGTAPFGLSNNGFRGMGLRKGEAYNFSAQVRNVSGSPVLRLELYSADGELLDSATVKNISSDWKKCTATLHPRETDSKARLLVLVEGKGTLDIDMVSLFPEHTWRDRPGGLRADMVQLLADMKPGFLRFPGGCIVEGSVLDRRYQWKNTIGPIEDRKLLINRWNYEFLHKPTPDYFQSFGLGFFEFFQLCEDIGAQPLPILNCGMACQFNSGELVPLDKIDPFVQDALDLIEFANGPATSTWGAKRAAMGHPEPFNLKMMGVGNEQWGPQYIERLPLFIKAIKEKHPEIQLVSSAGPSPADDRYNFLWPKLVGLHADIVDEHCYANPIWFLANSHRYDRYDRNGPKIFMGEYAAQSVAIVSVENKNNLECALAEAAYMTGLERNADVVRMASYAPLFAHIDGWQWTPNLIWTDNLRVYGTPNYYVQKLFSRNRGDVVLPVDVAEAETPAVPGGSIGLGTHETAAEFKDVRVTRDGQTLLSSDFTSDASGWTGDRGNRWAVKDGAYQQADPKASSRVFAGEDSWRDYTLSLKARKLGGSEGFMIIVRYRGPEEFLLWNVGGYHNKSHTLLSRLAQQDCQIAQTPGSIENGRWYDVKVELKGSKVNCYLDGKLVTSADVPPPQAQHLYASAARDEKAGDLILKVVNPGDTAEETDIQFAGASNLHGEAATTVLSGDLSDVNSLDAPRNIAPAESKVMIDGPNFKHTFPPRSFTVLRVPAGGEQPVQKISSE
jgi:alpha-L-arabinofuranosidase